MSAAFPEWLVPMAATYEHRRSPLWLKMKCELTQNFIVGGFTDPQGSRVGLGALLVGYEERGAVIFAAFIERTVHRKLRHSRLLEVRG